MSIALIFCVIFLSRIGHNLSIHSTFPGIIIFDTLGIIIIIHPAPIGKPNSYIIIKNMCGEFLPIVYAPRNTVWSTWSAFRTKEVQLR